MRNRRSHTLKWFATVGRTLLPVSADFLTGLLCGALRDNCNNHNNRSHDPNPHYTAYPSKTSGGLSIEVRERRVCFPGHALSLTGSG